MTTDARWTAFVRMWREVGKVYRDPPMSSLCPWTCDGCWQCKRQTS